MSNKFEIKRFTKGGVPIIAFWKEDKPNGVFSPWYNIEFYYRTNKFINISQWIAYRKAIKFNDQIIADKILLAKEPSTIKSLEAQITNFDQNVWLTCEYQELFEGNYLKFKQNDCERYALYETYEGLMLYASPYDRRWGIGMSEKEIQSTSMVEVYNVLTNGSKTIGTNIVGADNLLGKVLMDVRHKLKHENLIDSL